MSDLEQRILGRTGLPVTVLGFGAMELRNRDHPRARPISSEQAESVLNAVLDGGINYIDTSPDYGDSEEHIGKVISHRRDEYFLASKCGCPFDVPESAPRPLDHDFSRENIVTVVDRSLKRMRTDYLDVLQFHSNPSQETLEREGAIDTILSLRDQGKVRFVGSSSTLPNLLDLVAMGVFDVFQTPYSALQREHHDGISQVAEAGAGVVVRGGVSRGEPGVGQGADAVWAKWDEAGLDDLLDGASRTEFMMRFTISHPGVSTTIVGTLNPAHVAQNIATAKLGPLPPEIYQEATRRLDSAAAAD